MKDYVKELNELYDKKLKTELDAREAKKSSELAAQSRADELLQQDLRSQANSLAAQQARTERSFNERALSTGLSDGAGEQLRLALESSGRRSLDALNQSAVRAKADSRAKLEDIESSYKADIAEAIGKNDYERAQALMKEYKNLDKQQESEAKLLSQYGDFSGYEALYGKEVADSMLQLWKAKNQKLAYKLGIY